MSDRSAPIGLIGYTGFVGGMLLKNIRFDFINIGKVAGQHFDVGMRGIGPARSR
jgi:hypothetical protein